MGLGRGVSGELWDIAGGWGDGGTGGCDCYVCINDDDDDSDDHDDVWFLFNMLCGGTVSIYLSITLFLSHGNFRWVGELYVVFGFLFFCFQRV